MPTIRIDDDVYSWLKSQAIPFEDTPNSVLRRLAGLDKTKNVEVDGSTKKKGVDQMRITGKYLKDLWTVDVAHALYHQDGTFFENLREFPGALFDSNGYIVFKSEREYNSCRYLNIGQKLNVPQRIS